ncbi:MAG: hypothetical protein WCJ66_01760 [Verrucomicrobiota bacterium]
MTFPIDSDASELGQTAELSLPVALAFARRANPTILPRESRRIAKILQPLQPCVASLRMTVLARFIAGKPA